MLAMGRAEIKLCCGTQMLLSLSEAKSTMGFFLELIKYSPEGKPYFHHVLYLHIDEMLLCK